MWVEGTGEQQCGRLAVSIHETGPKRLRNVLEKSLIEDDQAHRAAPWIRNMVGERLFKIPGAERIITDLAQRSPKKGTKPLVGHHDEHSRVSGPCLDHRLLLWWWPPAAARASNEFIAAYHGPGDPLPTRLTAPAQRAHTLHIWEDQARRLRRKSALCETWRK